MEASKSQAAPNASSRFPTTLVFIALLTVLLFAQMCYFDRGSPYGSDPYEAEGDSVPLEIGDRIQVEGGYSAQYGIEPEWAEGGYSVSGHVERFIPGQNDTPAAVMRLDEPVTVDGTTGDIFVLELRYSGATWGQSGVVHIEFCDFAPPDAAWKDRRQGEWVESHASYSVVSE